MTLPVSEAKSQGTLERTDLGACHLLTRAPTAPALGASAQPAWGRFVGAGNVKRNSTATLIL